MKKFKFMAYLLMMVSALCLGFASCGDDDDKSSDTTYNETAVKNGEAFYTAYEAAETTEAKSVVAAQYVLTYIANKDSENYAASFWVGVAAQKYGYTDNLDKAAEHVDELDELKNMFESVQSGDDAKQTASELAVKLLEKYISKNS